MDLDNGYSDNVSLFDICSSVNIVPFENVAEAFVDENTTKDIAYSKDCLYFLDKNMKITMFDYQGHWLGTIDKVGRGPGEYTMASSIIVNNYTHSLDVLCPSGSIYKYDLTKNAEFVGKFDFTEENIAVHYFTAIDDHNYLLFSGTEEMDTLLYDSNTGIVSFIGDFVPSWLDGTAYSPGSSPFFEYHGEILSYNKVDGRVFCYDRDTGGFRPKFSWDVGRYLLNIESIEKNKSVFYYEKLYRKNIHKVASPFAYISYDGRKLYASFRFHGIMNWNSAVYDEVERKVMIFKKTKEGLWFLPGHIDEQNHIMYRFVNPELLNKFVNESVLFSPSDLAALKNISEDSNIVMVRYSLL